MNHQIVVPICHYEDVLSLAHELPLAGHLGINKTYQKVLSHFYWPGLFRDVFKVARLATPAKWLETQPETPVAPLKLIPAVEEPI